MLFIIQKGHNKISKFSENWKVSQIGNDFVLQIEQYFYKINNVSFELVREIVPLLDSHNIFSIHLNVDNGDLWCWINNQEIFIKKESSLMKLRKRILADRK